MVKSFKRHFWRISLSLALKLTTKITVTGKDNIASNGPYILICNHFSYWDPLLLLTKIPLRVHFMAAIEMTRIPFLSHLVRVFEAIPVWRGQVDRKALREAEEQLNQGGNIGVFPEGGIIPELQAAVARGETIVDVPNTKSRIPAVLAEARPGTAYVAVRTEAQILPVAIVGSENLEGDLRRFSLRRTKIEIHIGKPYGPLTIDKSLRGRERRKALDELSKEMMFHIADLLPESQRGVYIRPKPSPSQQPTKSAKIKEAI